MNPSEPADPPAPTRGSTRWTTPCTSTCPACPTANRAAMRALPPHKPHTIVAAVNHFLKKTAPDARLTGCVRVDPQKFHARFSATGRTYHYRMHVSPTPPSLFERGRVWHVSSGNGTGVMVGGGGGGRRGGWGKGRRWGLGFGLGGDASCGGAPRRRARLQHVPRERVPGVVAGAHAVGHTRGRGPVVAAFPGRGDRISPARRLLKNAR